MAEVFLGTSIGAEGFMRRVAIKRVLPDLSDNPEFARMFVAEAKISSRLAHPNIVSVIDFDRDRDGRLFLVMEWVDGRDLGAFLASGPLPPPVVIFIVTEILRGLGHAHDLSIAKDARGLVHRDVSPHNVLLSWEGAVKVSDFGIAKARSVSKAAASAFLKGKPAYMSPEQVRGEALDGRADLFAVGVILWELLVGKRLFDSADTQATLDAVLFGPIARPRLLRPTIAKDVERVALRLLERDPRRRYPNAETAIHDLLMCSDAPKAGGELLRQTLAERFPREAPLRPSARRITAPPDPAAMQPPGLPLAPVSTPSSGLAGLTDMMSARTGTVHQATRPRREVRPLWLGLALATLGAVLLGLALLRP